LDAFTAPRHDVDPDKPPDWPTIPHEVLCPLCEYNLHGLTTPRCPECGYRFDWPEVLDPKRAPHPYLFEHHPECNVRSYFRTMRGTWRPRRFWASLYPTQPSCALRLLMYWCLGLACISVLWPVLAVYPFRVEAVYQSRRRANTLAEIQQGYIIIRPGVSIQAYLNQYFPSHSTWALMRRDLARYGPLFLLDARRATAFALVPVVVVIIICWPWLTVAALMIFQISIKRARLKPVHVMRCVLYSFDVPSCALVLLAGVVIGWWAVGWLPTKYWMRGPTNGYFETMCALLAISLAMGAYRLHVAYRQYLRFHWPLATVATSQALVFLCCLVGVQLYNPHLGYMLFSTLRLLPRP